MEHEILSIVCDINILPVEIMQNILSYISQWHGIVSHVNHLWREVIKSLNRNKIPTINVNCITESISLVTWATVNNIPISPLIFTSAIKYGDKVVLKWLQKNNFPQNGEAYYATAYYGHLELLLWFNAQGFPLTRELFYFAMKGGNLDIIKYLYSNRCPMNFCETCVKTQNLGSTIVCNHEHNHDYNEYTFELAIICSHLHVAQWLRDIKCPWDGKCYNSAAMTGNLCLMKWLDDNCCNRIPSDAVRIAIDYGHINILDYLYEKNWLWYEYLQCDSEYPNFDDTDKDFWNEDIMQEYDFDPCTEAVSNGNLNLLKWLHDHKCPWNEDICSTAALNGNLEILKYLHENKCFWNEFTCQSAAKYGHLDCLQYAHENGCPHNYDIIVTATEQGHLNIVQYLHENFSLSKDIFACTVAARNGYLEILQYLHKCGYFWDEYTCSEAAKNGHLEILKYLHKNGCSWDGMSRYSVHNEILQYLVENKCPIWQKRYTDN